MSETVHYKGKLVPITVQHESPQEAAIGILLKHNIKLNPEYDSCIQQLDEEVEDQKYFVRGKILYKIETTELDPDDDIMHAEINTDGSIDFEVKYYNGGGDLTEALDQSITNADIDDELDAFYSAFDIYQELEGIKSSIGYGGGTCTVNVSKEHGTIHIWGGYTDGWEPVLTYEGMLKCLKGMEGKHLMEMKVLAEQILMNDFSSHVVKVKDPND